MAKNLLIVESPAKARTIKKYLGSDFEVLASYGHVRDLVPKEGSVDPDHNFAMKYELIAKNAKHINAIINAFKQAEALYLATDPDREGEAISWHVYEVLKSKKVLKKKPVHRVAFYEITQTAVKAALSNPRLISMDLVNAQQARRALDYLVGFNLSPLLWKKIRRGLSAGRVQSPALRLIVEREEAIEQFKSREYWTLEAQVVSACEKTFSAHLIEYQGEKLTQFSITDTATATQIQQALLKAAKGQLLVTKVEKKQRKRNPASPFTTSTLQQEAASKLGFTAKRSMRVAQQLYEGLDVGHGPVGLITYMRTDAVHLASEVVEAIRTLIGQRYSTQDLPPKPNQFRTKSKNAQEAHEAIRPTDVNLLPEQVKAYLTAEQFKLYDLIWKRTIASQMIYATINTVIIDLSGGEGYCFRASGSTIAYLGFMAVYSEDQDETKPNSDRSRPLLPPLQRGDQVILLDIITSQHFTEPPPRYSEASLIKTLEEYGIGRPSTYVPIISTLQQREYVLLEQKYFRPTDVGRIVNKFLVGHFMSYLDYNFTAKLEDELDAVSRGEKVWGPLLEAFWQPFKQLVVSTEKSVQRQDVTHEALEEACPKCGQSLSIRLGKRGRFVGCLGYPECDYTRSVGTEVTAVQTPTAIVLDRDCPACGQRLQIKQGRYGQFIGCSHYPKCKHIESLEKPLDTGVACPECSKGSLLKRKSRYNKLFYSCSTYPVCHYAVWNEPIAQACSRCAWPMTTLKTTKRRGHERVCPRQGCGYAEALLIEEKE